MWSMQNIRAFVTHDPMRRQYKIVFGKQEGGVEFVVSNFVKDVDGKTLEAEFYQGNVGQQVPDEKVAVLPLPEETARSLMEELQREFGVYAGVDYERLRKDYDRVAEELREANAFIREQFGNMISKTRRVPTRKQDDDGA